LKDAVKMCPTPKANKVHPIITDHNREKLANRNKANLEEVVAGRCNQATGSLNPDWVELLMGFPVGFTDMEKPSIDKLATQNWQGDWEAGVPRVATGVKNRVGRLKCLGNAVVPQVVEMIGRAIVEVESNNSAW